MVPLNSALLVAVLLSDYAQHLLLKDITPSTLAHNKQQLRSFLSWLGDAEISARAAAQYLAELRSRGLKRSTIRSYYYTMKLFLDWQGLTFRQKIKLDQTLPCYHCREDIARLFRAISGRIDLPPLIRDRDLLIVRTLALTGIRSCELLSLRSRHVRGEYLFVEKGKGQKQRTIPLTSKLQLDLAAYIKTCRLSPPDLLFPMTRRDLYSIVKFHTLRAGITDLSPHGLRHYFATSLVERGAGLRQVQELLGHANLTTTAIYLDVTPQHLRNTIDLLEDP